MRSVVCWFVLVGILVACEGGSVPTTSGVPTTSSPETTATSVPAPEYSLAHSFRPGGTASYDISLRRHLLVATEGDPGAPLDQLPGSLDVTVTATGAVGFEIERGPGNGTNRLVPTGGLEVTAIEGTADGEPVEAPDLAWAGIEARPEALIIRTTGEVIGPPAAGLEVIPSWADLGGFLGPVMAAGGVGEGEPWTSNWSGHPFGPVELEWEAEGRIAQQTRSGGLVVEGTSRAADREVDLSRFYRDFLGSFDGEPAASLIVRFDRLEDRWTGFFDPTRGRLQRSETDSERRIRLRGTAPERGGGGPIEFGIDIRVEDRLEVERAD